MTPEQQLEQLATTHPDADGWITLAINADWSAILAAFREMRQERDELRKYEAVCHCGVPLREHRIIGSCTSPSEMEPSCPNASEVAALRARIAELYA